MRNTKRPGQGLPSHLIDSSLQRIHDRHCNRKLHDVKNHKLRPNWQKMDGMQTASNKPELTTFGQRLVAAVLEKSGPTEQESLSKWFLTEHGIHVSGPMISKYKTKDSVPRMDRCRAYAVAVGVTVEWLLTGRGARYPQDGPISDGERRMLGMWRRLSTALKRNAFDYVERLRLTPDISEAGVSTEEELDAYIADRVTESGELIRSTVHESPPEYSK